MRAVNYDDRRFEHYARGRALSTERLDVWLAALADLLPSRRPLTGLDLGAGIGRFTPALARTFGPVVGIEPSDQMRGIAEAATGAGSDADVTYLRGTAEDIPLSDDAVDYTLVFLVWHHVLDRRRGAREIARVTRPGGRLLIRTQFSDRMPHLWWLDHFPRGHEADASMYEPVATVTDDLEAAGWRVDDIIRVTQPSTRTRREVLKRLQLRTLSTFDQLTEQEQAVGFASLERAVAAAPDLPVPPSPELVLVASLS